MDVHFVNYRLLEKLTQYDSVPAIVKKSTASQKTM